MNWPAFILGVLTYEIVYVIVQRIKRSRHE